VSAQGKRRDVTRLFELQPGEYGKLTPAGSTDGVWYARTPNGHFGCLRAHDVTEHEDGTITVSPSILVTGSACGRGVELYHGWLQRGVWT
jgi:hypothetical protein